MLHPKTQAAVTTREFLRLFSAVMIPLFMAVVDQTLLATATPSIVRELGGLRDVTWIALSYMMGLTITAPLYGRLGDQHGRRDVLLVAMSIFALGSLICGIATSMAGLVAGRAVQGLGAGGLIVLSQALIGEVVPPRERGRFQAYFATNYSLGSIGGPIIGGLVVQHANWRWLFLANLPLCVLAAWRVRGLPQSERSPGGALTDLSGLALFAIATATTLIWVSFGGHRFTWVSGTSIGLLAAMMILWSALIRRESRCADPFLPVALLQMPEIRHMTLAVICFGATLFSLVFFLPIFLQLAQGHDASGAGLLLLPLTIGIVLGATFTGRLISRFGRPGWLPLIGLGISAAGLLALALASQHGKGLVYIEVVCGLGLGSVMPTAQIVVQAAAGRDRLGAATALVSLSRTTGAAIGTAAFGALIFAILPPADLAIINAWGHNNQALGGVVLIPPQTAYAIAHAFQMAFLAAAAIALVGCLISWPLRKLRV